MGGGGEVISIKCSLKYQDGIFQECPNFVSIILSHNLIFQKSQFSSAKHFVKKDFSTMAVIPHILDFAGSFISVGSLRQAVKYWCVTHSGAVLASVVTDHTGHWDCTQWEVQIENTSSIVFAPKGLDWPYPERLCCALAWTEGCHKLCGRIGNCLANPWQRQRGELYTEQISPGMPLKGKPKFILHKYSS